MRQRLDAPLFLRLDSLVGIEINGVSTYVLDSCLQTSLKVVEEIEATVLGNILPDPLEDLFVWKVWKLRACRRQAGKHLPVVVYLISHKCTDHIRLDFDYFD